MLRQVDSSLPLVSICCTTYNHENFIAKAIEGFLMQETSFNFEIIIRDDASTDHTREIINSYKKIFPQKIKTIYEAENTFSKGIKPMPTVIKHAMGKYIALCEGDDYWIDKNKLERQVSFLENNPSYCMSFHRSNVFDEERKKVYDDYPHLENDQDFSIYDFIALNWASTASVVRRNVPIEYPKNFNRFKLGDWPVNMIYASKGKVKYHADIMSVYRMNEGGIWAKANPIRQYRFTLYMLEEMNNYFNKTYNEVFSKVILQHYFQLIEFYLEKKQILKAFVIYKYIIQNYQVNIRRKFKLSRKIYKTLLKSNLVRIKKLS